MAQILVKLLDVGPQRQGRIRVLLIEQRGDLVQTQTGPAKRQRPIRPGYPCWAVASVPVRRAIIHPIFGEYYRNPNISDAAPRVGRDRYTRSASASATISSRFVMI